MLNWGYLICDDRGPLAEIKTGGFWHLGRAGHSRPRATLFETSDEAKTAIINEREYHRHTGDGADTTGRL